MQYRVVRRRAWWPAWRARMIVLELAFDDGIVAADPYNAVDGVRVVGLREWFPVVRQARRRVADQ